jgi:hypothetical protein
VYLAEMIALNVGARFGRLIRSKDHMISWSWWRSLSTDIPHAGFVLFKLPTTFWVMWIALYVGCYLPLYAFSRGYLVVACFINIFHLPESIFSTPNWNEYVPHIN